MTMQVTRIGLQSIANAQSGGYLLNLSKFAVTEFPDVVLSADDTDLAGTIVYEGVIDVVEVLDDATVRFTVTVPKGYPTTGVWNITELGIYQDSGELFARGKVDPVYSKDADVTTSFTVVVIAVGVAVVVNLDVGQYASVPATPGVKTLPDPINLHQNAIVVLDQNYNSDGSFSPSMAVKYGPGGRHWGFMGYDRVYTGLIGTVTNEGTFYLNPQDNGFFLDDNEQVIIQLTVGVDGKANQSRRFVHRGGGQFVDMGTKFTALDENCFISIWKREIPASYVSNTVPVPRAFGKTFNGDGNTMTLPFEPAGKGYVWVFAGGLFQHPGSFELRGRDIVFYETPPKDLQVSVEAFELVQGGDGTVLAMHQFEFPLESDAADHITLPVEPKSEAYVKVFFDGIYQTRNAWRVEASDVVFEKVVPRVCKSITVLVFEEQIWKNHNLTVKSYSMDTQGFSLLNINTQKNRDLDNPVIFLGTTFQNTNEFNSINNNIQFLGVVPSRMPCEVVEMYREPPQRILALKKETDASVRDGYAVGPNKIRLIRNDDSYFDIDLSSTRGVGKGFVVLSKNTIATTESAQLLISNGSPFGRMTVLSSDSSIAETINNAELQLDGSGNLSVDIQPRGQSRTVTLKVLVNAGEIGTVVFTVVRNTGSGMLTVNNSNSTVATPNTTLIFEVHNGGAVNPITLEDNDGNKIEIGYTDSKGYLEYVTKYAQEQFGRSRKLSVMAYSSSTKDIIGSVDINMVNNGPVFLVNGSVIDRVQNGENLVFTIANATPSDTVTWRYFDDNGEQSVQVGVTDVFGNWTATKSGDIFHMSSRTTVDLICEVGPNYIGKVVLKLLNNTSFLVDGAAAGKVTRNSRLTFEIINAEPGQPVYWMSSDDDVTKNNIGKTNDKGYLSFTQTYSTDIGVDRTVMYNAYVNDVATNAIALTIHNPTPKVLVNGLPSSVIYPDSTMVFAVQDAIPGSSIAIVSSTSDVYENIGVADSYGDIMWNKHYSSAEIVDGANFTIDVSANGIPIGTVNLSMIARNQASMKVNNAKAAVVSYGKSLTFDIINGVTGMPIAITDSEGATYATSVLDPTGTFSTTKVYGMDIGTDRTLTVYAQSENVILDQVQLIVLNNVGASPRFRVDGKTAVSVVDNTVAMFTITGAKPGAIVTWSIPAWDISMEPLGNIDRNGNLAYAVTYSASMFRNTTTISIEAVVDGIFTGTVAVTFV